MRIHIVCGLSERWCGHVLLFNLRLLDVAGVVVALGLLAVLLYGRAAGDFEVLHLVVRGLWLCLNIESRIRGEYLLL
jgi:hypothetical protein